MNYRKVREVYMFKEGQLVTAKEYNLYAVTDRGKPCEVVWCNPGRMKVQCLWNEGEEYIVDTSKFRPMMEDEIFKPGQKLIVNTFIEERNTEIATFMEYRDYGVRVRDSEGNYITLTMHSVKGVMKDGLYI